MTVTSTEPRAWVGCLACYTAGNLNGEWVVAGDSWACPNPTHEETWVMDHENTRGLLDGECSPCEFDRLVAFIEHLDDEGIAIDAAVGYLANVGISWTEFDRDDFDATFFGETTLDEYVERLIADLPRDVLDHPVLSHSTVEMHIDADSVARDLSCSGWWEHRVDGRTFLFGGAG